MPCAPETGSGAFLEAAPIILWTEAAPTIEDPVYDRLLAKPVLLDTLIEHICALIGDR